MKDETLHAVEMTREIRDRMYEETKDMAADELIHYFKEKARLVTPPPHQEEREARRSQG